MADLAASYPHLFQCTYPTPPISWGKDGRTHGLIIDRIKHFEDDLKKQCIECKVGGDMNFIFKKAENYELPEMQAAREQFMKNAKKELCAELEKKRDADPESNLNWEINSRLKEIRGDDREDSVLRGFSFEECFMAKLNHDCRDIVEFNFPRADHPNALFDKPVKGYFDQRVPEFQMQPADCLTFLNNTEQVYATAQEMAKKLGYEIIPGTQHIHFSVWKDGKNLTTRDENGYNPAYVKILESVAHLTNNGAFLIYPINRTGQHGNDIQYMRISENKIPHGYEMTLLALKDRFEFRALNSDVPHLALALLINVVGVHIGMTKHTDNFCKKNHIFRATPEKPVRRPFFVSGNSALDFMFKQCAVDKKGYFVPSDDNWFVAYTSLIDQQFFDKKTSYFPPLTCQLIKKIQVREGHIIVPNSFEANVRNTIPLIDEENLKDPGETAEPKDYENGHKITVTTPPDIKKALEKANIYEYHTLIYENPFGISLGFDRPFSQMARQECFTDPLLKEYFGKALTTELAKNYNQAFDQAYPRGKETGKR